MTTVILYFVYDRVNDTTGTPVNILKWLKDSKEMRTDHFKLFSYHLISIRAKWWL